ncbi:LacI family DNA-binding transcriptional regulator [Leuconostoc citreum]|uniref:LacI family DNA-binding transcriptional regulator n=1 Tax=Leuconostoc citreum TaxID=33964 RepID=UPI001C1F293E|nr:LacI family DNA-binding transcriptional regulator [Leuconostoc citreum]MBU7450234.1 LacI family DNA-binding transcriptional regulator [Leuconostoc citreum]
MVSIRDVARQAGLSPATVSRVLNQDDTLQVTEQTRQRVIEVANKLNYQLKKSGRRTAAHHSTDKLSIALISTFSEERELNDPYFRSIRTGIEVAATRWQIKVDMVFRLDAPKKNWKQLSQYGAVIIVGNVSPTLLAKIQSLNPHVVMVDDDQPVTNYDTVHNDFSAQSYRVLDYLFAKGHRNIAFVGADVALYDEHGMVVNERIDPRHRVYRTWMATHGLTENLSSFLVGWDTMQALEVVPIILNKNPRPTAIFAASDPIAIGLYRGLQTTGFKIPEDIAIVSFDDIEVAGFLTPSLTTVHPEAEEMGKAALRLARERLVGERELPVELIIPSTLMIRESV